MQSHAMSIPNVQERPFARRRQLTPDELAGALADLAARIPMCLVAQYLGVSVSTLREQLLDAAWLAWCAQQGVVSVKRPE